MGPDLRAEFRLTSRSLPIVELAAALPEARITVDEILRTRSDRAVLVCWIEADGFEDVEEALDAVGSIADWSLLESADRKRLYRLRRTGRTDFLIPIEEQFVERGATPIRAVATSDGWLVQARFPDRSSLVEYRERCDQRGIGFALERLYEPTEYREEAAGSLARLTSKQQRALVLAYEAGYYDIPRAATLDELSEQLDISYRSFSDRLRRAERRLVEDAVVSDRSSHRR